MRKGLLLLVFVVLGILMSCSQKTEEQNGFVEFTVEGQKCRMEHMRFIVRANPIITDGERIKVIPKGEVLTYEFCIDATEAESKRQLEIQGRNAKKYAEWKDGEPFPEQEDLNSFLALWVANTSNPEDILKSEITWQNQSLGLTHFGFVINIPDSKHISCPETHNCWLKIDEITENRVKGRFGGHFEMDMALSKEFQEKSRHGQQLKKEDMMREIDITDGVFNLPYKKCFKYR
ncbi:MAG: hypothetical protein AB1349_14105 [Elusimicrobiota bacterium]